MPSFGETAMHEHEIRWFAITLATFVLGIPLYRSISEYKQGRIVHVKLLRWWIMCTFILLFSLLSAIIFGFGAAWISRLSVKQVGYLTTCKILSGEVDLRWTKICRIGDLSPISLRMFGIPDRSRFCCSMDYYWVSALKVEFKPFYSDVPMQAVAEVPSQVLPSNCRPGFAAAWRVTESVQLNKTYPCLYSPEKLQNLEMWSLQTTDCTTEEPSSLKFFRDYLLIVLSSYNLKQSTSVGNLLWRGVYAILAGIAVSVFTTAITKATSWFYFKFSDPAAATYIRILYFEASFQMSCLMYALTFQDYS